MSCSYGNAHAQQQILRGCCSTGSTCCDRPSAYGPYKYCEVNNQIGVNREDSYVNDLCLLLTTGFTGQTLANSAAFYTYLDTLDFSPFICGIFDLYVSFNGTTSVAVGTVANGGFTLTNTALTGGEDYTVYIGSDLVDTCGIFTLA
jgi:hypothetical protein